MPPSMADDPWARPPRWYRQSAILQIAAVVVVALAAIAGVAIVSTRQIASTAGLLDAHGYGPFLAYVAFAVSVGGLAIGFRWPWPGLIVTCAGPYISYLAGWDPIVLWSMVVFVAFILTLRSLPGLWAGLVAALANYGVVSLEYHSLVYPIASVAAAFALAAAAGGSSIRGHQAYWDQLRARAEEAVATRDAEVERSVAAERMRIARDLHDVIGHQIAVVNMHLGAAQVHLPPGADDATTDITAARDGVQAVLRETQHILSVLRGGATDTVTDPPADFSQLSLLVEGCRAAGMAVQADLAEPPTPLPPDVSAAAYRIAQEALTNAQKHGAGFVSITLTYPPGQMRIEAVNVRDPAGVGRTRQRVGYGLVGMRERAESVGGELEVQADETTFTIRATLPMAPARSTP